MKNYQLVILLALFMVALGLFFYKGSKAEKFDPAVEKTQHQEIIMSNYNP